MVRGALSPGAPLQSRCCAVLLATAAACELPRLTLADVLRLCLPYARSDRTGFDRAIVRWRGHLCLDAGGLDAPTAQNALAAAIALPTPTAALPPASPPPRCERGPARRGPLFGVVGGCRGVRSC